MAGDLAAGYSVAEVQGPVSRFRFCCFLQSLEKLYSKPVRPLVAYE